jgi:hypothetical protein
MIRMEPLYLDSRKEPLSIIGDEGGLVHMLCRLRILSEEPRQKAEKERQGQNPENSEERREGMESNPRPAAGAGRAVPNAVLGLLVLMGCLLSGCVTWVSKTPALQPAPPGFEKIQLASDAFEKAESVPHMPATDPANILLAFPRGPERVFPP